VTPRAERLADGLWRWTAPSPHWRPGDDDRPDGWPQDVGCVLYVREGTATLIDPLVAPGDRARWAFLDDATAGSRVVVALTAPWHRRSAADVAARYGAEVRIHRAGLARLGLADARGFEGDGPVAPGVEALVPDGLVEGEVAYWIPEHGVLVTAEVLQGRPDGLRYGVSPAAADREALEAWLRGLERLPIELVLPTHGPPAAGGRAAIRDALSRRPWGSA
jgi:hypothetical protein